MTPSSPKTVVITFAGGNPVATPSSITLKPNEDLRFQAGEGVTAYVLDFDESPTPSGEELFDSDGSKEVNIKIKHVDKRKYKERGKRIKYDVIVNNVRLDPDVVIDPN